MRKVNSIPEICDLFFRETKSYLDTTSESINLTTGHLSFTSNQFNQSSPNPKSQNDSYQAKVACLNLIIFAERNPLSILLKIYFGSDNNLPITEPMYSIEEKNDQPKKWRSLVALVRSRAEAQDLLQRFVLNFGFSCHLDVDQNGELCFFVRPRIH